MRLGLSARRFRTSALLPTLIAIGAASANAANAADVADDPCAGFKWDVSQERQLFAGKPDMVSAGKRQSKPAVLMPDRLFELRLAPHARVKFPVRPGLKGSTAGTYAGLAIIQPGVAGTYRIAVDQPLWIDVDLRGQLLPPKDFEGAHGCRTPRKIVEFELTGPQPYVLQFSGAKEPHMRVTVTREPGH